MAMDTSKAAAKRFQFGVQAGTGWAYADESHLFNTALGLTVDYRITDNLFIQFAPGYFWLWKWDEHYLSLPLHLRKTFGERISLFAGPALNYDVGHFKDLGISAGVILHYSDRCALVLSATVFTLYDYDIDYLYVPVNILYRYSF